MEILAVGPNPQALFKEYWQKEKIPFHGLADASHRVTKMYKQEVNLIKLGRMPLNCVVDQRGNIRYAHYSTSMRDIPSNEELLRVIDELNASSG